MRTLVPIAFMVATILAEFWMLWPLDDYDLYTHITLGRWLPTWVRLTEAEIPNATFLAWLGGWLFAQVDTWAGLVGVQALHIALMICTFTSLGIWQCLVTRRAQGTGPSLLSLGIGMSGAFLVSASNSSARTQDFTYLGFALLLLLLEKWSSTGNDRTLNIRHSVELFILFVLWQNFHSTVLLSIPVILAYIIWRRSPWWFLLVPILASICTVNGVHIFSSTATNVEISRDLLRISEWLPPWDSVVRGAMLPFWIIAGAMCLSLLSTKVRRGGWDPTTTTISLLYFGLALTSARFGALWGFVTSPLFGHVASCLWPGPLATRGIDSTHSGRCWIIAGISLAALTWNPGPLVSSDCPLSQFQALKTHYPAGRIFNYREYGGALEYVGYPSWQVYIDGRLYNFSPDTWRRYEAIANAHDRSLVDDVVKTHDLLVLHPSYHRSLIEVLRTHDGVQLLSEDHAVVIFARRRD